MSRLREIALLFLKLGTIGFGGPAVHIATMDEEVVERRKWITREQFLDLLGATNLIPGPNSTEMAIHVGYVRGGLAGLVVAGLSFILPASLITCGLAWLYVEYGQRPQLAPTMGGIKPAVIAIILVAGWRLARSAIRTRVLALIAAGVALGSLLGMREIPALLAGSVAGVTFSWLRGLPARPGSAAAVAPLGMLRVSQLLHSAGPPLAPLAAASSTAPASLLQLGLFFLKVGAVLYGSGYVLVAYLQGELVHKQHWLTDDQLVDAIAVGQFTPGPILSTATFIGYVIMSERGPVSGLIGAAVASVAIFLPSFLLVAITGPLVPRLRKGPLTAAFLDSVNSASLGLMAAVSIKLGHRTLFAEPSLGALNWTSAAIALVAVVLLWRWKWSPLWIVLGGAAAGTLSGLVGASP